MKKKQPAKRRVQNFLAKQTRSGAKGWSYSDAPDLRQQGKVEHAMAALLWASELGLTSNQPTPRDVEEMTHHLGPWARALVPESISDTTLHAELQRLDTGYLLQTLVQRVRGFHRSKMLQPEGVPFGVATVDGKNLATLHHDAESTGHGRSKQNEKWHLNKKQEEKRGRDYFLMPALRAVLSSAEAKPCIYQMPLPPGRGEATVFPEMLSQLQSAYGHGEMFRVIDGDAGLTSLTNANLIVAANLHYILGLKGNQPELHNEAQALLLPLTKTRQPEVETPWQSRNGKRLRRRLWRTGEMAGMENSVGKWNHLRQSWLVRQETRDSRGHIEVEDRFFVTSLERDELTPVQILRVVRNHWAVENDCFNSLDLQWNEDAAPWCSQGTAIWTLGVLRLLAYNTAQMLRRRRLRKRRPDGTRMPPLSWRALFKSIEKSLELDALAPSTA